MSLRVGVDLAAVDAVQASLLSHADRYLGRIYTEHEIADSRGPAGVDPRRLAARFAAKEATLKVLATELGISLRDIEVRVDDNGRYRLELHGQAAELAKSVGVTEFTLDLCRSRFYAAAVVLADCS